MPILQVSYRSEAYGAETAGPPALWLSPHSACGCSHLGIWAAHWTSQSDDKAALRGDRPVKTMLSRGLSSLPESQTAFSPAC